jgi:hypothetical protein
MSTTRVPPKPQTTIVGSWPKTGSKPFGEHLRRETAAAGVNPLTDGRGRLAARRFGLRAPHIISILM